MRFQSPVFQSLFASLFPSFFAAGVFIISHRLPQFQADFKRPHFVIKNDELCVKSVSLGAGVSQVKVAEGLPEGIRQNMNLVSKMMNFVFKVMNFVSKMMNLAFKVMNLVLTMMN